jgi:phospho-N-acetylmuramoyl-pentapeptide-transferase
MLYWLASLFDFENGFNLFRYLTFRTGGAIMTALIIGLIIGPKTDRLAARCGKARGSRSAMTMARKRISPRSARPPWAGLMILTAVFVSMLLWMNLANPFVWACLLVMAGFGRGRLHG